VPDPWVENKTLAPVRLTAGLAGGNTGPFWITGFFPFPRVCSLFLARVPLAAGRGDGALVVGLRGGCLPVGGHGAPLAWSATGRQGSGRGANFPFPAGAGPASPALSLLARRGKFCAPGPPGVKFPALRGALG
jgi:hypothetical protein